MKGVLLIDKPTDWTSSDVVAKLRGVLREKRVGHAGTLDPLATGLLVVLVGRATRAAAYAESQEKRYLARLRLGLKTDTEDITGRAIGGSPRDVSREELEAALSRFRGEIWQVPPMYSAIKVGGQKLYEIARRGGELERKPRAVSIYELSLLGQEEGDWLLDVRCSKGTYIRSLCRDIGEVLGCGGCMSGLRRQASGAFRVEDACTLAQTQEAAARGEAESLLLPLESLFSDRPALRLDAGEERDLKNGKHIPRREPEGEVRVYGPSEFLALGEVREGALRCIKSFYEV